jgi:hypothetical protein
VKPIALEEAFWYASFVTGAIVPVDGGSGA